MGAEPRKPSDPDLSQGVPFGDLADGSMLAGHVGDEAVLLARRGDEVFAVGAVCTHYGAPARRGAPRRRYAFAALGIMPASACAPARRCARRR